MTRWLFVSAPCGICNIYPCRCELVTVPCDCGGTLTATHDLESKRRSHTDHVLTPIHQAYRYPRRPTAATVGPSTCQATTGASAVEGAG